VFVILFFSILIFFLHAKIIKYDFILKNFLDNIKIAYWEWSPKTGYVFFNKYWYIILGYKPYEFKPTFKNFEKLIHEDDKDKAYYIINKSIESFGNDIYQVEFRLKGSDNEYLWIQALGRVIKRDKTGKASMMRGIHINIDDLKNKENIRNRFYDYSIDMLAVSNFEGYFMDINSGWSKTLQWSYSELLTKKWLEIVHPDDISNTLNEFQKLLSGTVITDFTNRYITKEGKYKHLQWTSIPDTNNKLIFSIVKDVTDNVNNQKLLKESEEKYRKLFNSMLNAYALHKIILDNNENPVDYQYIEVNPAFERILGVKREDVIGKTVKTIFPKTEDLWIKTFGDVAVNGKELTFQNYFEQMDRYYKVYAYSPEKYYFSVTFIDITENVKMQNQIIQSDKMATIGTLTSGLAHEINNPLAIVSYTIENIVRRLNPYSEKNKLLLEKFNINQEELNHYYEEINFYNYIKAIKDAKDRIANIINNLLSLTRAKSLQKTKTDINNVIEKVLNIMQSDFNITKKYDFLKIKIEKFYGNNLNIEIYEGLIEQVLMNIFKNAGYSIQQRFKENMQDGVINISTYDSSDFIIIKITDNGIGISDSIKTKVFDPFFTTKPTGEGTGLGLSLSYSIIINDHSGKFYIDENYKNGASFIIELPK